MSRTRTFGPDIVMHGIEGDDEFHSVARFFELDNLGNFERRDTGTKSAKVLYASRFGGMTSEYVTLHSVVSGIPTHFINATCSGATAVIM